MPFSTQTVFNGVLAAFGIRQNQNVDGSVTSVHVLQVDNALVGTGIGESSLPVVPPGVGTGTDASSNAPAIFGGALIVGAATYPQLSSGTVTNPGHLYIQNQSSGPVYLALNTDGTPTIIAIDPGAGAGRQGGDWQAATNVPWFVGAFSVFGVAGSEVGVIHN